MDNSAQASPAIPQPRSSTDFKYSIDSGTLQIMSLNQEVKSKQLSLLTPLYFKLFGVAQFLTLGHPNLVQGTEICTYKLTEIHLELLGGTSICLSSKLTGGNHYWHQLQHRWRLGCKFLSLEVNKGHQ